MCVNPDHFEIVSHETNEQRKKERMAMSRDKPVFTSGVLMLILFEDEPWFEGTTNLVGGHWVFHAWDAVVGVKK